MRGDSVPDTCTTDPPTLRLSTTFPLLNQGVRRKRFVVCLRTGYRRDGTEKPLSMGELVTFRDYSKKSGTGWR